MYRTPCYVVNYIQSSVINLPYEVSSNQTRKVFVLKMDKDRRDFLFIFSLLVLSRFERTFRCVIRMAQRPLRTTLWRYSPVSSPPPLTDILRVIVYYFPCQLPLFCWTEVKSLLRPGQMHGGGVKKHSNQPNSFYCVHREIATSSTMKLSDSILSQRMATMALHNLLFLQPYFPNCPI